MIGAKTGGLAFLIAALMMLPAVMCFSVPSSAAPAYVAKSATGKPKPARPDGPRLGPRYRGPGGDASAAKPSLEFEVLAPEEAIGVVGFVSTADPVVNWYLCNGVARNATLRVTSGADPSWTGSAPLPVSGPSPYHNVRFSTLRIGALVKDRVYNWWITLSLPDGGTAEMGSFIRYVPFAGGVDPAVACGADTVCAAERLAGENYWYDALERLSPGGTPPTEPRAKALWSQLMADVGLQGLPADAR